MTPTKTISGILVNTRVVNDDDNALIAQAVTLLACMPVHDAAGAAFSYLLLMTELQPGILRILLNEKVVKSGFVGESMINVLQRAAR